MNADTKPFGRRWSSPEMAPLAARALVKHSMNATRAAKELRPHLTDQSARKTGSRMIHTLAVLTELEKLTDDSGLSERSAQVYIGMLWEWLERLDKVITSGEKVSKDEHRLGLVAATLLGRRYLKEQIVAPSPGQVTPAEGFEDDLVKKLTGLG